MISYFYHNDSTLFISVFLKCHDSKANKGVSSMITAKLFCYHFKVYQGNFIISEYNKTENNS